MTDMTMMLIIGAITFLGVLAGTHTFFKTDKIKGISQLVLAAICPLIAVLFLSMKEGHAFGGTDWEYLVHSATIDRAIWPWINLLLFIVEIYCILKTLCMAAKNTNVSIEKQ